MVLLPGYCLFKDNPRKLVRLATKGNTIRIFTKACGYSAHRTTWMKCTRYFRQSHVCNIRREMCHIRYTLTEFGRPACVLLPSIPLQFLVSYDIWLWCWVATCHQHNWWCYLTLFRWVLPLSCRGPMTDIYSPTPLSLKPPKEVPVKKQQPLSSQQAASNASEASADCLSPVLKVITVTVLCGLYVRLLCSCIFFRLKSVLIWKFEV
jgi:hypothetical protein